TRAVLIPRFLRRLACRTRIPGRSAPPLGLSVARRVPRRRIVAALSTLAVAWVSYAVYAETMAGHSADSRVQTLQKQNDALRAEIDQRRREISVAQSDSWLMQEARRLGYVLNGETVYVPVPSGKAVPASGGIDPGPAPSFQPPGA